MRTEPDRRIAFKGGDEEDALGPLRRYYYWKPGQLQRTKHRYWRRFRHMVREWLRKREFD